MGDDTPLAVLSERYRPLSHFFRQNFSQVTNPPIDPLREHRVMSLKTRFGNLANVLARRRKPDRGLSLESPVLTNGMFERMLKSHFGGQCRPISIAHSSVPRRGAAAGARLARRDRSACATRPKMPCAPAATIWS